MTKAIKAAELYTANPGIANADFVKLLMSNLGMSLAGARTYAYNVRNGKVTTSKSTKAPKASKAKKSADKVLKSVEKSAEEVAQVKAKNLKTMQAVTKKHNSFREQLDDVIKASEPGFDPDLARIEIREDEEAFFASQGIVAKPQKFD